MLAEHLLGSYSASSLKVIARRRGLDGSGSATKSELIRFLGPRLFSREANRRLVRSLPERQKRLLAALKARGGEAPTVALAAAVDGRPEEVAADLRNLIELGLLLYPRSGRPLKHRLGECERVWLDRSAADAVGTLSEIGARPKLLASPPPVVIQADLDVLLADVFVLLNHLERHELRPLRDGFPGRRGLATLGRSLLQREETSASIPLEQSGRLFFIYVLVDQAGLLKVHRGRLVPAEGAGRFFRAARTEQARRLFDAWRRQTLWNEFAQIPELVRLSSPPTGEGDLPSAGRVLRARARVLRALRRFDAGRWYSFSSLRREIKSRHPDFLVRRSGGAQSGHLYRGLGERSAGGGSRPLDLTADWDAVEGRFVARLLLGPLHWLGALSPGFESRPAPGASHLDSFRITPEGAYLLGHSDVLPEPVSRPARLLVQPDFNLLLLSGSPHPALLHDLSRFAAFTGGDHVARFTLTRESVCRGFRDGWDRRRLQARLEEAAGSPLPQNVVEALAEWERASHRFRIVSGVCVVEDTEGHLPPRDAARRLHSRLGEPLAPGLWRLPRARIPALAEALKRRRMLVRRFDYAAAPTQALSLSPTLELMVGRRPCDWITGALLRRFAVPVSEEADRWRLDASRVRTARRDGLSAEEILRSLETRSSEVPTEVRLAILAWCGRFTSPTLRGAALFRCDDPALLRLIQDTPAIASLLDERLAADTFVVSRSRVATLRSTLGGLGIRLAARPGRASAPSPDAGAAPLPFRWSRSSSTRLISDRLRSEDQLRFLLVRAIEARRRVRLEYVVARERRAVPVEISPLMLEDSSLTAFCHRRGRQWVFRLERIAALELQPQRF